MRASKVHGSSSAESAGKTPGTTVTVADQDLLRSPPGSPQFQWLWSLNDDIRLKAELSVTPLIY
jgi:hypothetical protein